MDKMLKTQEVAKICHVAQGTVIRWIKEGRLPAAATAGGHNRILLDDVIGLLKNLRMPIPSELNPQASIRILVVDDEPGMRDMVHWMIQQHFTNVLIEEAKEGFVAGWKAHDFRPDLVLLDLMLPGLDGFHVCELIRQLPELKHTKIIAMSALNDPDVEKRILALGANVFLPKPFETGVLKEKIESQLSPRILESKGVPHE